MKLLCGGISNKSELKKAVLVIHLEGHLDFLQLCSLDCVNMGLL